ncbi:MAG TPA: NIPSNAP family protein [Verrucomicrobiae bacterium]|nr:NIPSNAP family protein [Verrucomicrobiae bacterium]
MKHLFFSFLAAVMLLSTRATAADTKVYEMRIYYAPPGKLDDLHARFRDHTLKLFEKHGIESIGYWTPIDNPDNRLIYIIAFPSREAREKSWKEFFADPDWQAAQKQSELNGRIVAKVENFFMQTTDYSPAVKVGDAGPRIFELRTYTASAGNLEALNARFRDHTVALFQKHGMVNFAYWNKMKDQKGADSTLVYMLAHKSKEARDASFKEFGGDPDWVKAKNESEKKAGGPLTEKDGVKSVLLKATDYSPTK